MATDRMVQDTNTEGLRGELRQLLAEAAAADGEVLATRLPSSARLGHGQAPRNGCPSVTEGT